MKRFGTLFTFYTLVTFFTFSVTAQKLPSVQIIQDSINSSLRGLSVPSDNVIWVSGTNGTVGRSVDGGKSWRWMTVRGFEKRDFRDIEAWDSLTAVIMAVDNPANILKTADGGRNWKVVFHKEQEGMFLDAMDFADVIGVCIGDPIIDSISGKKMFFLAYTVDRGDSWTQDKFAPFQSSSEAIFAASGSNIIFNPRPRLKPTYKSVLMFITGGTQSNLVSLLPSKKSTFKNIPILQGRSSSGAFSITNDQNSIYITGGDYVEYWKDSSNVVYTSDLGKTWQHSSVHGYRSCIIRIDKRTFITCGTNGVDLSADGCKTFKLIHGDGGKGKDGFNVCAKSKSGKAVYFAGTGRIGKLIP